MNTYLLKNILRAYKGRRLWLQIIKRYKITTKKYVLLLPSQDMRINYIALSYLKAFMNKKKADEVLILTNDDEVVKTAKSLNSTAIIIKKITKSQIENIMKFYCLYNFTDRLIIGSLKEPEGRVGEGIIGKKGITEEDLFKVTIYGLDDTVTPDKI